MSSKSPSVQDKLKYSLVSALIFLLIASPIMFQVVQAIFGGLFTVASPGGCPTIAGLLLHTVVFFGIIFGLMFVKF